MRIESLEPSDAVLVEAAQHGRLDGFGALYQRYHNPIVALAYAQLGDKHSAEDAAQEVFAIACRDLRSLRDRDRFGAWLGGICRNVTRQMLRVKTRTDPLSCSPAAPGWVSNGIAPEGGGATGQECHMEQQERWDAVRQAVWKLPEAERELVVMRYFDGFSQARISQVLDMTPAAVNGRLTRAKRRIAELLERDGFGSESWDA
ncbi:MAG: RNA polymerase sigma factor [Sedimentisphaerales bacterium]|nr:RNA polymerase sigma factor [Sedimentisphaerales bacterium]